MLSARHGNTSQERKTFSGSADNLCCLTKTYFVVDTLFEHVLCKNDNGKIRYKAYGTFQFCPIRNLNRPFVPPPLSSWLHIGTLARRPYACGRFAGRSPAALRHATGRFACSVCGRSIWIQVLLLDLEICV